MLVLPDFAELDSREGEVAFSSEDLVNSSKDSADTEGIYRNDRGYSHAIESNPEGDETRSVPSSKTSESSEGGGEQCTSNFLEEESGTMLAKSVLQHLESWTPQQLLSCCLDEKEKAKKVGMEEETAVHRGWKPVVGKLFSIYTVQDFLKIVDTAKTIFMAGDALAKVTSPVKIFGDLHGQLSDLLEFFDKFGSPEQQPELHYLFLGDYVDRGEFSLEVMLLLFSLQILFPERVTLLRGNHEDRDLNSYMGFKEECQGKLGLENGELFWESCNNAFDHMPLAAVVDDKIFCAHAGIGGSLQTLDQILQIPRPVSASGGYAWFDDTEAMMQEQLVGDLLWSDPVDSDNVLGVHANPSRGALSSQFGIDRVESFCEKNNLTMIIRSHQCVANGYQYFANKMGITVFSAVNYCGRKKNAGGCLLVQKNHDIVPMIIQPKLCPTTAAATATTSTTTTICCNHHSTSHEAEGLVGCKQKHRHWAPDASTAASPLKKRLCDIWDAVCL